MADITVKQKEAKTIKFTISGSFSLAATTFQFSVKKSKSDTSYTINKVDADFDKTDIATRIIKVSLSATDLNIDPRDYTGELKITFSPSNIDKSADIDITVEQSVIT